MYKLVSETGNLCPRNLRMQGTVFFRNIVRSFSQNNEIKYNRPRQSVLKKQIVSSYITRLFL